MDPITQGVHSKNIIVLDVPKNINREKLQKFHVFFTKTVATKTGVAVNEFNLKFFFNEDDTVKGAFIEFARRADAERAVDVLNMFQITKNDTLTAFRWDELSKTAELPDEYQEPRIEINTNDVDLTNTMMYDLDARPQYIIKKGSPNFEVEWHWVNWKYRKIDTVRKASFSRSDPMAQWSEFDRSDKQMKKERVKGVDLPMWTPYGTYLISQHDDGLKLWAGSTMSLVMHVNEADIQQIQVSPHEQFLVVKTASDISLWSIAQAKRLRSLRSVHIDENQWPAVRFNADDTLCSVIRGDSILVYDAASMSPVVDEVTGKALKVPGIIDASWNPADGESIALLVNDEHGFRVEICTVDVEYEEELTETVAKTISLKPLMRRNFITAKSVALLWQPSGEHLAAKVEHAKTGTMDYSLFQIGRNSASAHQLQVQGSAVRFNWQPSGNYFAVIVEKPKSKADQDGKANLELEVYDISAKPVMKKLGSVKTAGLSIMWSPKTPRLYSCDFAFSILELIGIDEKAKTIVSMGKREHQFVTNAEWDPTGRFFATWTSNKSRMTDNRYIIGDMNNRIICEQRHTSENLVFFAFRPVSKPKVSSEQIVKIKKELPKYIEACKKIDEDARRKELQEEEEKVRKLEREFCNRMDAIFNFQKQRGYPEVRALQNKNSPSAKRHREIEASLGTILDEKVEVSYKE